MGKQKRSVLEDIVERVGELIKDFEHALNPRPKKPALAPVPVRNDDRRRPRQHPYR